MTRNRWIYLLLFAISFIVYIGTINYPFFYDDNDAIVSNVFITDLANLKNIFLNNGMRPVLFLTFAVNHAISGLDTWSFRLVNILLHAFTAILVFSLAQRLLKEKYSSDDSFLLALATALIFAIHPAMSETVIYIASRSSGLVTFLYFICLLIFLKYRDATTKRSALLWYIALWAVFLPGLLVKENLATVPIIFALLDFFWFKKTDASSGKKKGKKRRIISFNALRAHLPFWILLVSGVAYRFARLEAEVVVSPLPRTVIENIFSQANTIIRYIGLLFAPHRLSIAHGYMFLPPDFDISIAFSILTIIVILVSAALLFRVSPVYSLGVFWFFISIAPTSSFFPLQENMAEHRMYLPAFGAFLIIAAAMLALSKFIASKFSKKLKAVFIALLVVYGVIFGALTLNRATDWQSELTIWADAVEKNPDYWGSHYAFADALRNSGNCKDSVAHYFAVNALHGEDPDALINLGICFFEMGEREKAPAFWRRGLAVVNGMIKSGNYLPDVPYIRDKLYNNLGRYSYLKEDYRTAQRYFAQSLSHDKGNVSALKGMALIAMHEGRYQEAKRFFQEASWQLPKGSKERLELEKAAATMAAKSLMPLPPSSPYD